MKIRSGFVSNSSSSSYIIYLPDELNIDDYINKKLDNLINEVIDNDCYCDERGVYLDEENGVYDREALAKYLKKDIQSLVKNNGGGYWGDENPLGRIINTIFDDFVIASIDTGPDSGGSDIIRSKDIRKIEALAKSLGAAK